MSELSSLLDRINSSTSYRELQALFTQLELEAEKRQDSPSLAAAVDEAILRIEQERIRDQSTMESIQNEYSAFKQEHAGVIGWFRRKIPFTNARKQELEHRESVSEQEAEILADNLFIARAQMLKEAILPSDRRRLGLRATEWRDRIAELEHNQENDSVLRNLAKALSDLTLEIHRSDDFLKQIDSDVEAFSSAKFSDSEDRLRKDSDLAAAKKEAGFVRQEISEEKTLRTATIRLLSQSIHEDLLHDDANYRDSYDRLRTMETWKAEWSKFDAIHNTYREALKLALDKRAESQTVQTKMVKQDNELRESRRAVDELESKRLRLMDELRLPQQNFERAKQWLESSKTSFAAAKKIYDAYLQEQNKAEVSGPADFEMSSPVTEEYERLKQVVADAESELRRHQPAFESTRTAYELCDKSLCQLRSKNESMEQNRNALIQSQRKLEGETHEILVRIRTTESQTKNALHLFGEATKRFSGSTAVPKLIDVSEAFSTSHSNHEDILPPKNSWTEPLNPSYMDAFDVDHNYESAIRLANHMKSNGDSIHREIQRVTNVCKQIFANRSSLFVDDKLASELRWPE